MIRKKGAYLTYEAGSADEPSMQLQTEGWLLLKGVFDQDQVETLKHEINEVFDTVPPDQRGPDPKAWDMFRYEMLNRSAACQAAVAARGILDVIEPLLGEDCHVIANTAWRNPPTQEGQHAGQAWHIDAGPHIPLAEDMVWPADIPHPVFAIGTHIYLLPCDMQDGPTGVIPGSHHSGTAPPRERMMDDDLTWQGVGVHPLLAEPGDVGFFVSDLWHRRTPTQDGDRGRFFLQVHYGRRDIAQRIRPTDAVNHLSEQAIARAQSEREKTVIGLHPRFFYDG